MQLLRFKEWVTLEEAAQYLKTVLTEEVTEADVLSLSLEGYLRLSIKLDIPAPALYARLYPYESPPEDISHPLGEFLDTLPLDTGYGWLVPEEIPRREYHPLNGEPPYEGEQILRCISGVWDIAPFDNPAWQDVYEEYGHRKDFIQEPLPLDARRIRSPLGVTLLSPYDQTHAFLYRHQKSGNSRREGASLDPDEYLPTDCLPKGVPWIVRTKALREFEKQLAREETTHLPGADEEWVSEELALVNEAARQHWSTAEPQNPGTHPSNDEIAAWLQERGMSQRGAQAAAQIIRPEWAHKGRRPKP